ncbi:hypothetical protein V1264_019434 [Littorina saxatilis]|uniref:Uncharacterized protein n=1 Tax=Littorina saxatilis TaxID=31220 RepID=A0AAN9BG03_9CAEN
MAVLPPWYKLCSLVVINVLFETGMSRSWGNSNPLEADDILKKHIFGNHHQCQRLCWYIELCERFSFYTKNLDDAHPHNCVLHAGEEKDDDLSDGWMQEKASGDYLPLEHECRNRTCGKQKVCVPGGIRVAKNVCNNLPSDVDECASSPCQNRGNCVDGDRTYTCNCLLGYIGDHCETDVHECASSPCQNGGTCVDGQRTYRCNCLLGYIGDHCETDIDECASNPCTSGQSCQDQVNGYTCCQPGYTGKNCTETWLNETCAADSDCTNHHNTKCYSGQCLCADGLFFSHTQATCEQDCAFTPNDAYLHYKHVDLYGENMHSAGSTDATACAPLCNERPTCRVFVVLHDNCWLKAFTAQDQPQSWINKTGLSTYQRTCP